MSKYAVVPHRTYVDDVIMILEHPEKRADVSVMIRFRVRIKARYSPLEPRSKVGTLVFCPFDRKDLANIYSGEYQPQSFP